MLDPVLMSLASCTVLAVEASLHTAPGSPKQEPFKAQWLVTCANHLL
jgi:hypothetical protein